MSCESHEQGAYWHHPNKIESANLFPVGEPSSTGEQEQGGLVDITSEEITFCSCKSLYEQDSLRRRYFSDSYLLTVTFSINFHLNVVPDLKKIDSLKLFHETNQLPHIYIIGIDAASREHASRSLKLTYAFLRYKRMCHCAD
jgi:hypothetical protein